MAEPSVRDRIIHALEDLPPDTTIEEAIERLVFLAKVDAGLAEFVPERSDVTIRDQK